MQLSVKWDTISSTWINRMPTAMMSALGTSLALGVRRAAVKALGFAKADMPVFEATARDALGIVSSEEDRHRASAVLGFTNDSVIMPDIDVRDAPTPFNYGWAKHSPGARPHEVWLYNYETGGTTRGRKKLVRWLKEHVGGPFLDLPEGPTADYWNRNDTDGGPPPFVTVDPRRTATPYFSDIVNNASKRNAIFGEIRAAVGRGIRGVW